MTNPTNNPTNPTNATGGDIMTVSFIHTNGTRTDNLSQEEAMRLYAASGFTGRILKAPEATETAPEATPAPNGWETLPGASESYVLTVGDRCPECKTGRIIQGRAGLGCAGFRDGCTVHQRIRKDGRYFPPAEPVTLAPSSPWERMNANPAPAPATDEPPFTLDDELNIKTGELYRKKTGVYPSWWLAMEGRYKALKGEKALYAAKERARQLAEQPAPTPAPQPIIEVTPKKYKAGEVDPEAKKRVEDQRQYLEGLGFATADTIYPPGSQVVGMGQQNFNQHKRDLEAMPTIEEECSNKAQIIADENRRGFTVAIKDLSFDGDVLRMPNGQPLQLEWNALKSWSAVRSGKRARDGERVSISPPLGYLRHSSAQEIGQMFEARKEHAQFVEKKTGRPQRVQLLTREVNGQERSVYAVVSPTYQYYGGDRFLQNIAKAARQFGSDLKGEVIYNQATTRVTGEFWAMPPHIENLAAGDVFKVGTKFRTGDNGSTSHTIDAAYLRNLCLNLLILDRGALNLMKRRHSGRAHNTSLKINHEIITAMKKAFAFEQEFRTRYGWMKQTTVADLFGTDDMEEIVTDVLTAQRPKAAMKPYSLMDGLPGDIQRDALVEALMLGVTETAAETGQRTIIEPTMADIINVVTRAHDKVPVLAYSGDSVADHIARRAGEMVTEFGKVAA